MTGFKSIRLSGGLAFALLMFLAIVPVRADITGGGGTGDITFHSSFYPDVAIAPSNSTGTVGIPSSPGSLAHDAMAPGGAEHSYMAISWNFTGNQANVFIPAPTGFPDITKLEMVPSPPNPGHHAATMTGSFDVLYSLDAGGLPTTTMPGQSYDVISYISTNPGSPSSASFDAHWDYTDVGFGLLGSQDIHYDAPFGFGVVTPVGSLPLSLTIPAGHTGLRVTGYFKLSAESDDDLGGPLPYDTLIAVVPAVPEPAAALTLLATAPVALCRRARSRGTN